MKLKSFSVIYFISIIPISGQLSNELIWSSRTFYPKNINGINPSSDGDFYTSIERKNVKTEIVKYSYKKNKKIATLFSNFSFENFNFSDYDVSNDGNWLLLFNSKESIYRRSSKSYYYLYNIKEKSLKPLADTLLGKQRLATFSPDYSKIAYVRNNNLYYKSLNDLKEKIEIENF